MSPTKSSTIFDTSNRNFDESTHVAIRIYANIFAYGIESRVLL